jgi:hypothetical protein
MKAQKTMSTTLFFIILSLLYLCLILVSCRTVKSSQSHSNSEKVDSVKILHAELDKLKTENHNLRMREAETDRSGILFSDPRFSGPTSPGGSILPIGSGSGTDVPCPEKPINTVEIKPDGTIHASGNIKSVNLNKSKSLQTDQHTELQEREHTSSSDSTYFIQTKVETWHNSVKKVTPSWMYYAMGIVALIFLVIGWMAHKYKDRLSVLFPSFYLPQKR